MNKLLLKSAPMVAKTKNKPKIREIRKFLTKNWKRLTVTVIVFLLAFFIYKKATALPKGLETGQVTRGSLVESFSANGKIRAKKQVDLKFYSPGKLTWVGVKNGDKVHAWQGIASLDTVSLNAAYQQALNNYKNYQAAADLVLDSVQGHSSNENFATRATRTSAEVARDNAFDAMIAARSNLKNAVIVTPISGTVVDTNNLVAGVNLSGADVESKYIRVVDLSTVYFEAQVDEVDFAKVKIDQDVKINTDAFDNNCDGVVTFISNDGSETTGGVITVPVEVKLINCSLGFAVGLNGEASFVTQKLDNVLVIDKKYVVIKNDESFVWKQVGKSPKAKKLVPVKTGSSSSVQIEITDGLSEGDTVIFIPA